MKDVFRWEADGAGGDNGLATFFLGEKEVKARVANFEEAFTLSEAFKRALREARFDGRASVLLEIARIEP